MGKQWKQWETWFWGSPKITGNGNCSHEIKRHLPLRRKALTNLDSMLKSRDIILLANVHIVKAMVFPIWFSTLRMWELNCKEGWAPKNWCFQIVVLEKTREFLALKGAGISQSWRNSTLNIHWKDWCWSSNTLATWCKELTHWKRPWWSERWRRQWQPTPVFLPGKSYRRRSLVGCRLWGHTELDTTEVT